MVIYEVNAVVASALLEDYLTWLRPHAQKMLTFEGFERVRYFCVERELCPDDARANVSIQYQLTSQEVLDDYFERHVGEMRRDPGIEQFEGQLTRTWRVMTLIEGFEGLGRGKV